MNLERIEFTFTLDGHVWDRKALWRKAANSFREENHFRESDDVESEIKDFMGTEDEPDVQGCLIQLLDPGSLDGMEIYGSDTGLDQ